MSAAHIILSSCPSLCQKLLKLVDIWCSSDKNNFGYFFAGHGVQVTITRINAVTQIDRETKALRNVVVILSLFVKISNKNNKSGPEYVWVVPGISCSWNLFY